MKNISFALSATTAALMAGTAWAGNGGPYHPAIDVNGYPECVVYDAYEDLREVHGYSIQTVHGVEAGSGNINAVCTGSSEYLTGHNQKKALHFNYHTDYQPCSIELDEWTTVYTEDWKQVLAPNGNFTLTCHYKPYDED